MYRFGALPVALALTAALAGAALPSPAADGPVRIGVLGTDVASGPLYAQASGAFAAAGLPVDVEYRKTSTDLLDALRDGSLDVAFVNIISAVHEIEGGAPFTIVAPAALYDSAHPITVMLAPKDHPVRSGADLNGKTISVPAPNDLGEIATRNWVDRHGGDSKTVHYVSTIAFTDVAAALISGRVDAAEMSEPIKTEILPSVSFAAATFDDIAPKFVIGVFLARNAWLQASPDAAKRFVSAMAAGDRWANTHHAETAAVLTERYHTKPEVLAAMVRAGYPEALTPDLIQPVVDVAARYGVVTPIRAASLLTYLNATAP
jgi:ABC-type nitrate/sulfonate/bicarbonate transport system substrate-binding protein